jgi:hypothetical protein
MSGLFSHFMNHHAVYLKWGWIQVSVTNLIVILLMFTIFALAIFLPFPNKKKGEKK